MREANPPTIATPCPRCGAPTVWALRDGDGDASGAVLRAGCDCQLSPDQWADLAERANALLDEREETPG
jgi:hypothetical protein